MMNSSKVKRKLL